VINDGKQNQKKQNEIVNNLQVYYYPYIMIKTEIVSIHKMANRGQCIVPNMMWSGRDAHVFQFSQKSSYMGAKRVKKLFLLSVQNWLRNIKVLPTLNGTAITPKILYFMMSRYFDIGKFRVRSYQVTA
jgi:hypothetical protein